MPEPVPVEDPADPRLADYLELTDAEARRRRERDVLFVAEGVTAIERLLASGHRVRSVVVTPQRAGPLRRAPRRARRTGVPGLQGGPGRDRSASTSIAGPSRPPTAGHCRPIADAVRSARRIAVLEGLNDPENLGAIARSARALGVDALVLDPTCIDPYYRRTVRVSMGEVLHLPVARAASWPADLDVLAAAGVEMWALTPEPSAEPIWSLDVPPRVALLLGAEGPGLSAAALARADRRVRIPIARRRRLAERRPRRRRGLRRPVPLRLRDPATVPPLGAVRAIRSPTAGRRRRGGTWCRTPRRPAGPWPAPSSWPSPWLRPRGP